MFVFGDVGVEPVCNLRTGGGWGHGVDLFIGEQLHVDDKRGEELGFAIAGFPEFERKLMIGFDYLCDGAGVAEFYAKLVVGRAGLDVVFAASIIAEGLEL